jgi:TolA-binding protein
MKHNGLALLFLMALGGTSLSSISWADTATDDYRQATELYNARLYTTAAQELKKFVDANPTHPSAKVAAYQWAASLYRAKNGTQDVDFAAAIKAYDWALQRYPTAPANIVSAARFELGEAHYLNENSEKAISVLTEFLKNTGSGAEANTRAGWANYYLGKSYADLKKVTQAKAAYETVGSKYATTEAAPDALLELGLLNLDANQNAVAIAQFTAVRTRFPNSDAAAEARVRLGEAQLNAKSYSAARETLRAALTDPKVANYKLDILQNLAAVDFAEKKWNEAAQSYEILIENLPAKDSRRSNAQLQRANAFFNAKNWTVAVENYSPLLKSEAKFAAPALYYTAGCKAAQGNPTEAASLYRQFLTSFPNHSLAARAGLRLGDALVEAKEPNHAIQAYKTVLTRYANSEFAKEAQNALTDLAGTSDTSEAVENALRDLPASTVSNTKLRLAQLAYQRGEYAKSAQLAYAVAASKPDATTRENALYLVGSAKLSAKDAVGATSAFKSQLTAFPKGKLAAQANLGLAWAYEDQKKWAESEMAARAALAIGGDKNRAQLALANALLNGGKLPNAVIAYGVVENSPDKTVAAQGAQGSATALEKQNLWREAAAKWGKRATLLTDSDAKARAHIRRGLALIKAKDNANARLAFNAAAVAAPKSEVGAQALYEAAWLEHDNKQTAAEIALWTRLENDFPNSKLAPEAIFQNGELALSSKKWDEAAAIYTRLIQKYPQSELVANANFSMGTAYFNSQKWPEAANAFSNVGNSKEKFAITAPFWAAESYRKSGDFAKSAPLYQRFVQSIETNTTAPIEQKELIPLARLGWGQSISDTSQAIAIFQPAIAIAKGKTKTELLFRQGEALASQKKWKEALSSLLSVATTENEWQSPAQWLTGQALENTDAKSDALAMYQKLALKQPTNEWTEKAVIRVKELTP